MITSSRNDAQLQIIARPNLSASWRTNQLLIIALALPSLTAGIGFALLGAWPILPFVGLEFGALGAALYYVQSRLQYRHVITVSDDKLHIEKGARRVEQTWRFARESAGLTVITERHPWEGPGLTVHDQTQHVVLGEFLSRDDTLALLDLLQGEIRTRAYSFRIERNF